MLIQGRAFIGVLDGCSFDVQEAHNLFVPKGPNHVTALVRFTALRRLSLLNTEGLSPGQVRYLMRHASRHNCYGLW